MSNNQNFNHILTFSGDSKDWGLWGAKYLAKATIAGHKKVLLGTMLPEPPKQTIPDAKLSAGELESRRSNELAYCELLLAMKSQKCMQLVSEAVQ